jgi:hypothetical protein
VAEARSGARQRVCGAGCRRRRRAKHERQRRRRELDANRADERIRQRRRRGKGVEEARCHWPPEAHKDWEALDKIDEVVRETLRLSLAALRPRLRRILGDFGSSRVRQGVEAGR